MSGTAAKPWSLRRRLTRRVALLVAAVWLVTILLASWFLNTEINEMLDEELQAVAETTRLYLDATEGPAIPRSVDFAPDNGEQVLRILRLDLPEPAPPWTPLTQDGFSSRDGWRVLRLTAENAVIEVAQLIAWRREEIAEAASAFLLLMLPMIAALIFGLRHFLRQALHPLDRLSEDLARRAPADPSPLSALGLPRELTPLADGLNGYIQRIEALRQAERKFVANAAHELRTPVAAIRARIEFSQAPEARAALPLLDNLIRRVERLLQLSRSEAGLGLARGPSDLVQIIHLLLRECDPKTARLIRFDDSDLTELQIAADADAVAILLRNLIENAVEHGSGAVALHLAASGQLSIRNPTEADGFKPEAFQKGRGSNGMGLGLSIVSELASAMAVPLQWRLENGMAEVVLQFPRA